MNVYNVVERGDIMNSLFLNATTNKNSSTLKLAKHFLSLLDGTVNEVKIHELDIKPFDDDMVNKRFMLAKEGTFDDEIFKYAKEFANADFIVIAAPVWDLSFPSKFKVYIEHVNATGITFKYTEEGIKGLCKAKSLVYFTTSGGQMILDFGYEYVKTLANVLYGIFDVYCFYAEGLDIWGADVNRILDKTLNEIDEFL